MIGAINSKQGDLVMLNTTASNSNSILDELAKIDTKIVDALSINSTSNNDENTAKMTSSFSKVYWGACGV